MTLRRYIDDVHYEFNNTEPHLSPLETRLHAFGDRLASTARHLQQANPHAAGIISELAAEYRALKRDVLERVPVKDPS